MLTGMLYLDDNKETTFEQKIKVIKDRFNKKYSAKYGLCNTCYVNPTAIKEETVIGGIKIKQHKSIMKNMFWIGCDEYKQKY